MDDSEAHDIPDQPAPSPQPRVKPPKPRRLAMYGNPIFDVEADEDDADLGSGDDEDNDDLDRDLDGFVVGDDVVDTQAIVTSELDEEEGGRATQYISMQDFYRRSLLTPGAGLD